MSEQSDFNDYQRLYGAEAVRSAIANAKPPALATHQAGEENAVERADDGVHSLFSVSKDGVFHKGEDEPRWICSRLKIAALVRDKGSENWGRLLEFNDADGGCIYGRCLWKC